MLLLCAQALTLTLSRTREREPFSAVSQTCTSPKPRSIGPFSRWREKAGDEGASEFLLCALALTLTLSRMREREPFSAVLQTCASPQHPRDRPLLPLAGEGGG